MIPGDGYEKQKETERGNEFFYIIYSISILVCFAIIFASVFSD